MNHTLAAAFAAALFLLASPITAANLTVQDEMRKRWLIDQLFSDPFASKIVPFEAWFMANVAPVIKF